MISYSNNFLLLFPISRQAITSLKCWLLVLIELLATTVEPLSRCIGVLVILKSIFMKRSLLMIFNLIFLSFLSFFLSFFLSLFLSYLLSFFLPSFLSFFRSISSSSLYQELLKACPFRPAYYSVVCILIGQVRTGRDDSLLCTSHYYELFIASQSSQLLFLSLVSGYSQLFSSVSNFIPSLLSLHLSFPFSS